MNNKWVIMSLGALIVGGGALFVSQYGGSSESSVAAAGGAFDQYGYNDTARIFNGTGASWCEAGGQPANCMGDYSADKLVMKWTADWDRGNDEGWSNPPYEDAWLDNEWNGKKGGSGSVWHYKIIWVGVDLEASPYWAEGGYPVWGQFEVIMDQGMDPSIGPGHMWFAKAIPNGYGAAQ